MRVGVLVLPANHLLTTPEALAVVGPQAFDFNIPYTPPRPLTKRNSWRPQRKSSAPQEHNLVWFPLHLIKFQFRNFFRIKNKNNGKVFNFSKLRGRVTIRVTSWWLDTCEWIFYPSVSRLAEGWSGTGYSLSAANVSTGITFAMTWITGWDSVVQ